MTGTRRYQLFLSDECERLVGHQEFSAESDTAALILAGAVFRACRDQCFAAEVWSDGLRAFRLSGADADLPFWVIGKAAETAMELEEALANSQWPIARSRRLIAAVVKRNAGLGQPSSR